MTDIFLFFKTQGLHPPKREWYRAFLGHEGCAGTNVGVLLHHPGLML